VKVGDVVLVDCLTEERLALVLTNPRPSLDREILGTMTGDIYEVMEVLLDNGQVSLITTDEVVGVPRREE